MDYVKVNFVDYVLSKKIYMPIDDTARFVRIIPDDFNLSGEVYVEYRLPDGSTGTVPAYIDDYGAAVCEADDMIVQEGTVMAILVNERGGEKVRSFPLYIVVVAQ